MDSLLSHTYFRGVPTKDVVLHVGHRVVPIRYRHHSYTWVLDTMSELSMINGLTDLDLYKTALIRSKGSVVTLVSTDPVVWDSTEGGVGSKGELGDRGPAGFDAPPGPRGAMGATGLNGIQGPPGPKGEVGEKGLVGNQGPQGDRGPDGFDATSTQIGPPGDTGDEGPKGPVGDRGPTGPASTTPGPKGPDGNKGTRGVRGDKGPTSTVVGPKGATGDKGPTGPQGPKGPDGVADTTVALKGETGDEGPIGPQGPEGPAGPVGTVVGDKGLPGNSGIVGDKGTRGDPAANVNVADFGDNDEWLGDAVVDYDPTFYLSNVQISERDTGMQSRIQPILVDNASASTTLTSWNPNDTSFMLMWNVDGSTIEIGDKNTPTDCKPGHRVSFSATRNVTGGFYTYNTKNERLDTSGYAAVQATDNSVIDITAYGDMGTANVHVLHLTTSNGINLTIDNGKVGQNGYMNNIIMYQGIHTTNSSTITIGASSNANKIEYDGLQWYISSSSEINANISINNSSADRSIAGSLYQTTSSDSFLFNNADFDINTTLFSSRKTLVLGAQLTANKAYSSHWGWGSTGSMSYSNRTIEFDVKLGKISSSNSAVYGFDYAEYFENASLGVIPPGTILVLDGDKVRPAIAADEPILGPVSSTAGVIGNDPAFSWQGRYLRGDFGEVLYENVKICRYKDHQGTLQHIPQDDYNDSLGVLVDSYEDLLPLENPEYDPTRPYTPRAEREKEYSVVGIMGKVYVRVSEDMNALDYVNALGGLSSKETPLQVLKMTKSYTAGDGYGIALCMVRSIVD